MAYAVQHAPQLGASVGDRIDRLIQKGYVTQVGSSATAPVGLPILTIDELEARFEPPWYKKPWVWALGAGALAVTGGALFALRRPRRE